MLSVIPIFLVVSIQLVSAHFSITYPWWRADSIASNESYNQFTWPCAGVPINNENRTEWPLTGGAVSLNLHHPWTYLFINLGLGDGEQEVMDFNISLTPYILNVTGKGDFCLPELTIPKEMRIEGQNATLQVVTNGASGESLYNCADIVLRANVSAHTCANASDIHAEVISAAPQCKAPEDEPEIPGSAAGMTAISFTLTMLMGLASAFTISLGM